MKKFLQKLVNKLNLTSKKWANFSNILKLWIELRKYRLIYHLQEVLIIIQVLSMKLFLLIRQHNWDRFRVEVDMMI